MNDNLSIYPDPFLMGQTSIAKRQHQKISPTAGIAEGDACSGVLVIVNLLSIMCHQLKADDARQIAKRVAASHSLGVTNRFSMIDNLSMYPDPFLMGQTFIAKRQHQKISPTAGIAEGDACSGVLVFVSLLAIMCHQLKADDFQHKPISEIINNGIPLFNTTHEGWGRGIFSWHHL